MAARSQAGLSGLLRRLVAAEGPLPLARFMALALGHPEHGYYMRRDPLGAAGDFTTAPEISQMFGELVGLWCLHMWREAGRPRPVRLVELGPGRGTLMADMLRAARRDPSFGTAAEVHLVETSPALRAKQAEALCGGTPRWHADLAGVPEGPLLLVANEFFDALPVHQLERTPAGWRERLVDAPAGAAGFRLVLDPAPTPLEVLLAPAVRSAPPGSIAELRPAALPVAAEIGRRVAADGVAALVIDYGHARSAAGDTLQAVKGHRFHPPLEDPGGADLTAHVDFEVLGRAAAEAGASVHGPVDQGAFLAALGLRERAAALSARADEAGRRTIAEAADRLSGAAGMGRLFKALAILPPGAARPPGF